MFSQCKIVAVTEKPDISEAMLGSRELSSDEIDEAMSGLFQLPDDENTANTADTKETGRELKEISSVELNKAVEYLFPDGHNQNTAEKDVSPARLAPHPLHADIDTLLSSVP